MGKQISKKYLCEGTLILKVTVVFEIKTFSYVILQLRIQKMHPKLNSGSIKFFLIILLAVSKKYLKNIMTPIGATVCLFAFSELDHFVLTTHF